MILCRYQVAKRRLANLKKRRDKKRKAQKEPCLDDDLLYFAYNGEVMRYKEDKVYSNSLLAFMIAPENGVYGYMINEPEGTSEKNPNKVGNVELQYDSEKQSWYWNVVKDINSTRNYEPVFGNYGNEYNRSGYSEQGSGNGFGVAIKTPEVLRGTRFLFGNEHDHYHSEDSINPLRKGDQFPQLYHYNTGVFQDGSRQVVPDPYLFKIALMIHDFYKIDIVDVLNNMQFNRDILPLLQTLPASEKWLKHYDECNNRGLTPSCISSMPQSPSSSLNSMMIPSIRRHHFINR